MHYLGNDLFKKGLNISVTRRISVTYECACSSGWIEHGISNAVSYRQRTVETRVLPTTLGFLYVGLSLVELAEFVISLSQFPPQSLICD